MEVLELVLALLACVIVSAVIDQAVSRVSLPLIQIIIGFVVALIFPAAADVTVDSELFLVLFIAPLLYDEARKSSPWKLWNNKGSIVSLAIGLVLVAVLVVGFVLHWLVPSIPLAAAFACAAALGPTDAAAVAALGSTVSLTTRQKTLLSGEALINDASGVVSFQFAIAAAVTGAFSVAEAGATFLVLFFGGIGVGVLAGFIARELIGAVRRAGFESTTVHVLYQVLTPFVVYLIAEAVHVSGILAVVATGLIVADRSVGLTSAAAARHRMVSDSVWDVLVFLINGIIFVLLGMQLPWAMRPTIEVGFPPLFLLMCVLAVSCAVVVTRYVWVFVMELRHRDKETGKRGTSDVRAVAKRALVTTIAGPKGAVTLSIILTIPTAMDSGAAFANRNLIIFITAGTILVTLLLADILLPRLAPKPKEAPEERERKLSQARTKVYRGVIEELEYQMGKSTRPEYAPATRLAIGQYRARLARERFEASANREMLAELVDGSLAAQEAHVNKMLFEGTCTEEELNACRGVLVGIRGSVGYIESQRRLGSRGKTAWMRLVVRWRRFLRGGGYDEKTAHLYYQSIKLAIELEDAAIEYLNREANSAEAGIERRHMAAVLSDEHRAIRDSLRGRIDCGAPSTTAVKLSSTAPSATATRPGLKYGTHSASLNKQYQRARRYADEVEAGALSIELDQIRQLRERGEIDERTAHLLREDVYVMQMDLAG